MNKIITKILNFIKGLNDPIEKVEIETISIKERKSFKTCIKLIIALVCLAGLSVLTHDEPGKEITDDFIMHADLPEVTSSPVSTMKTSVVSSKKEIVTTAQTTVASTTTSIITSEETTATTNISEEVVTNVITEEETNVVIQQQETQQIQTEKENIVSSEEQQPSESIEEEQPQEERTMTYFGNMKITGYVATGNRCASGCYPYVGGVAMARSYGLEFGTTIYIDGLGYYTLNDTGCPSGIVDVFCNSLEECYNLTSWRDVYIVN